MNDLLSATRLDSFVPLLAAYKAAGVSLHNAIDGGAGFGSTAKQMLPHVNGVVYAFEPFPGNHRFFRNSDERIVLIPQALAEQHKAMAFRVTSTVSEDSDWGRRGMAGYSSVGRLVEVPAPTDLTVQCVRGDSVVRSADFVKLDLQGGELNALRGMADLLHTVALMWVEYSGQSGLLDYIIDHAFLVFDTSYLFVGSPSTRAREVFEVAREGVVLSTGSSAWFGFKRRPWECYASEMMSYRKEFGLVQTDLVCVNRSRMSGFMASLARLQNACPERPF